MKAAVLRALDQPLKLEDVKIPVPGPEEVLIQVMACGMDAADMMILSGFGYVPKLPHVLGHETAGIITAVGDQVTDFNPGDRVAVYNYFYCGKCVYCRVHREQLCIHMSGILGILERPGGHAEYTVALAHQLVRVPENVAWHDAAVCCDAGITAFHAVDRGGVRLGETVLVIGIGGVGSMVTQICKASGTRVIVAVLDEERGRRALEMGADHILYSRHVNVPEAVRELTAGLGADCVIDVVGVEETFTYGMDTLRRGGRLVLIGYTPERYPLKGEQLDQNELNIIGTRGGRLSDLNGIVRLVAEGRIKSVVTDLFPLEEANEALAFLRSGRALGRVVLLTPSGRKAMGR
ncbi:MAG: zinc-binding dehydrogenase [Planctomycetes bacterium]|nr:zinc-binding dehydrogenase [Planctomycetota bacterium]